MVDTKVSESAINTQGYRQIDPLRPSSPLAMPKSATWNGLTIEHHLQPPAECELCLPQHTVCILLCDCQTERRIDGGHWQHNHAESGEIIVYPAAPALRHVLVYIHDHLDQQLTLAELSFLAGMSTYHFARTFKRVTGVAPHHYVLNARIERAKSLLLRGNLSIAEVAQKVGFFDQSHFTRYFKRLVGITPQILLRQNSKNVLK